MGVYLTSVESKVAFFDSTSGMAFGPTFDSDTEAEAFETFVKERTGRDDLRTVSLARLADLHDEMVAAATDA